MSCVERFSLRWDRYQLHLVTAFQSLLSESDFVDVTLGVEGKKLSAHKMLLSACSPYFRDLLKGNPCQHPIILLRGIPFDDLSALLQFMYNGEVSVNQDQLDSFLKSAEALKIQGLTDNSEEKNSPSPNQNQSQPKKEDSPQHSKRKRRASNQQHPGNNEHKDYVAVPVAKQPRNIKPEVVDVTEDEPEDEPELFNETNKDIAITPISQQHEVYDASVDNYDDNDIGEETGVYADAVYNEDGFSQDQQGWTDWGPSQQTEHETGFQKPSTQYKCEFCNKAFAVKQSLTNHLPSHYGHTTCNICGKKHSTRSNLNRHMVSQHGMTAALLRLPSK